MLRYAVAVGFGALIGAYVGFRRKMRFRMHSAGLVTTDRLVEFMGRGGDATYERIRSDLANLLDNDGAS